MDNPLTPVKLTRSWFTKLVGNRLKVYFKKVLGVWKIKLSKLQICRRHLPKNLVGRETFSTTRIGFLSKKEEEERHVNHVCKTFLRITAVTYKLSVTFNLTAIVANKKKMRVLKPTAGSNQRSVYVLKCYCNKINLFVWKKFKRMKRYVSVITCLLFR